MLAAMDHNLNLDRGNKTQIKEGQSIPRFKIAWHRYSKRFVAKAVKNNKSYEFLRKIAVNCYFKALGGEENRPQNSRKRLFVTPAERQKCKLYMF